MLLFSVWMKKTKHCLYKCFNVKRRYARYFANTLRESTLVSILLQTNELPYLIRDILESHIRPLLISAWIKERIDLSLTLHPYPWILLRHTYVELLPPIYKSVLCYSTVFHIITVDSVTYKIPAYFWCDSVYYTRHCPKHKSLYYQEIL